MDASFPFHSRWLAAGFAWQDTIPEGSVALLLLLNGALEFGWMDGRRQQVGKSQVLWLNCGAGLPLTVNWPNPDGFEALLLQYPAAWVRNSLAALQKEMAPDLSALLLGPHPAHPAVVRALEAEDRAWAHGFMAPTLCSAARQLLEGSRMSEFFFRKVLTEARGEELFCTRTRRLALDRVAKVREALLADLEQPPDLAELARLCGCNPQYLSRTFAEAAGTTISLYLRRLRIERAAELLSSGRMNASEAALEVGYRSLSHFSQAFREEKGSPPSAWLRESASPSLHMTVRGKK
ncbi:MAG: helix-turn-helix domain-containing protein [Prosthecobacter sp.]